MVGNDHVFQLLTELYNLLIYIYLVGVAIYSRFNPKVREMWRGERNAIKTIREKLDPNAEYVWFHAASLGEFEQGRPIIERLRHEHPEYKVLLTFFSPSGYEVRKNYEGADIVCYLPLDTIRNSRRFLRTIRPVMAFFIKYEFWYNYLHILRHRGVPVYSVSSIFRPDQIFFRWYGKQYARVLKCFSHFYVQNEESKTLLAKLGINNVTVTGDTRFDRVLAIKEQSKVLPVVDAFTQGGDAFVAGSSWQPDEEIFIPYFNNKKPEWKLIIAPHVIAEEHLQQIETLLKGRKVVRYKEAAEEWESGDDARKSAVMARLAEADALIINCFGLLSSIYRYGKISYVGGGFGVGIHNTLEAAVWGIPVIFGPNHQRFDEAIALKQCGGGISINSSEDFETVMSKLTTDDSALAEASKNAGQYVKEHSGATETILKSVAFK